MKKPWRAELSECNLCGFRLRRSSPRNLKRFFIGSYPGARWLVLPLLLCVMALSVAGPAATAQAESQDETGVPEGITIENFGEGVLSTVGVGGFYDQEHSTTTGSCADPGLLKYEKLGPIDRFEQIKKIGKDKTITYVDGKYLRTERFVTISCNGTPIRQYWQCTSCPPTPPPSILFLVSAHLRRKLMKLEEPKPTLWPEPSPRRQVPVPGLAFFYGIEKKQFNDFQTDWLLVCGLLDCASVSIRAKPTRLYFTPGDGTKRKTGCAVSEVSVRSKKDAVKKSYEKCRYVYQKAGAFNPRLEILYKLEWELRDWTWDAPPPARTGVMYGTTGQPFPLAVYERQPVVVG